MKVTIIVPVYNSENTIEKCVESVLNQTYKNIELLLINDGSIDNSINIIKKYKTQNIKIIDKKNEGVAKTRNLGIKKSTGDYIMFLDNDDYLEPDCVKNLIININDNDICIAGYKRVSDKKILHKVKLNDYTWSKYIIMAPWSRLYKKEFLTKNNIIFYDYKIGEDVYFNLLAYSKTNKIKCINDCSYNWYYNEKSVSNTIQKSINNKIEITNLLNKLISIDNIKANKYNIYYIYRYIVWYLLYSGKSSSSKDFIEEYNKLKKWSQENKIRMNIMPLSIKLKGESIKNRSIVLFFTIIAKFKLIKIFSKIYCKG